MGFISLKCYLHINQVKYNLETVISYNCLFACLFFVSFFVATAENLQVAIYKFVLYKTLETAVRLRSDILWLNRWANDSLSLGDQGSIPTHSWIYRGPFDSKASGRKRKEGIGWTNKKPQLQSLIQTLTFVTILKFCYCKN